MSEPKTTKIRVDELKVGDKVFTSAGGLDVTKIEAKPSGTYYFWIKNPRADRGDLINAWNGDWEIEIVERDDQN